MQRPPQVASRPRAIPRKTHANKHPGYAAVASAFVWGSGQIYADRLVPGLSFLWLQGVTIASLFLVGQNVSPALSWIHTHNFGESGVLLLAVMFAVFVASAWFINVTQAYRFARMRRRDAFSGSDSLLSIIALGIWLPGLGQFLNAQFRKGAGLLLVSATLLFSALASGFIALCWPYLQEGESLFWGEMVFLSLGFAVVLYVTTLVFSFYDAVRVNLFPEKRANIWKRMQWAWNRLRRAAQIDGARVFIRPLVRNLIFALSFLFVLNVGRYFFPYEFYSKQVQDFSGFLQDTRLTFSASLVNRSHEHFAHMMGQDEKTAE